MASDMLGSGTATVGEIGRRVDYDSEAAFNRAYKSHFGRSPGSDLPESVERIERIERIERSGQVPTCARLRLLVHPDRSPMAFRWAYQ